MHTRVTSFPSLFQTDLGITVTFVVFTCLKDHVYPHLFCANQVPKQVLDTLFQISAPIHR